LSLEPEAPAGDWFKRFDSLTLCGTAETPKTVLLPHIQPHGEEIFLGRAAAETDRRRSACGGFAGFLWISTIMTGTSIPLAAPATRAGVLRHAVQRKFLNLR
jgi:hypothetical protein